MWVLWLGHIHGLADAEEGGSTRQEERKLWVASVGRSLNLLTCKRPEQLDAIRSSVLAMLTLCQQGDTQIQTDSADTKAYNSSPLSSEMSDWA